MATVQYLQGRKKYGRPQAIMLSNNPGRLTMDESGVPYFYPIGYEVGQDTSDTSEVRQNDFLILSDHNRQPIDVSIERLEKRERTINGRMRSYHIADKRKFSLSWDNIPSRAFSENPMFDANGKAAEGVVFHTVDGGAGGAEMLEWYKNSVGSMWAYIAYDNRPLFGTTDAAYNSLQRYQEVVEVFIADFSFNISKRSHTNYDLWNVSMSLEEA